MAFGDPHRAAGLGGLDDYCSRVSNQWDFYFDFQGDSVHYSGTNYICAAHDSCLRDHSLHDVSQPILSGKLGARITVVLPNVRTTMQVTCIVRTLRFVPLYKNKDPLISSCFPN